MRNEQSRNGRRRGSVAAELILVMPVLATALLGTIEFSMLLTARQQLLAAAREGARVGSHGGTNAEIQNTIRVILDPQFTPAPGPPPPAYTVVINNFTAAPPNTRDGVEVLISVPATNLVPNLLPFVYDLRGQNLLGRAVMNLE